MSKYVKVDTLQAYCDNGSIDHCITPNEFQRMNHIEVVMCKDCKYGKEVIDAFSRKAIACYNMKTYAGGYTNIPTYFCADGEQR